MEFLVAELSASPTRAAVVRTGHAFFARLIPPIACPIAKSDTNAQSKRLIAEKTRPPGPVFPVAELSASKVGRRGVAREGESVRIDRLHTSAARAQGRQGRAKEGWLPASRTRAPLRGAELLSAQIPTNKHEQSREDGHADQRDPGLGLVVGLAKDVTRAHDLRNR